MAKVDKILKVCEVCKKQFSVFPYRSKARFCSCKCRARLIMPKGGLWKKGHIAWNKGKMGWTKGTKAGFQKGALNPSWNGGTSSFKDNHKWEWKRWREKVFKRDNYTCQVCKKYGGVLHPHHIKCMAHFPELRFVVSNGLTICPACHKKTVNYGYHTKDKCIKNENIHSA